MLRFVDKKVKNGRVVANPVIGYGYAGLGNHNGVAMDSYQIGISASSSGICVRIFGLPEKSYLLDRYGASIGKAKVTGHRIKFSKLDDIALDILVAAILDGVYQSI